jgi:SAM-dependent methyltransferase
MWRSLCLTAFFLAGYSFGFSTHIRPKRSRQCCSNQLDAVAASSDVAADLVKPALQSLFEKQEAIDPVLADPISKEALRVRRLAPRGVWIGGGSSRSPPVTYELYVPSIDRIYRGSSDTYLNLLEPYEDSNSTAQTKDESFRLSLLLPPPLQALLRRSDASYIPMRDLFTNPAVSFAYERGWRQGFSRAGFPGVEAEAFLALDYLSPSLQLAHNATPVLVDMSCATGLFTRQFAKKVAPDVRLLAGDYSDAMLREARRRTLDTSAENDRITWIRLDVGKIPFRNGTVSALHAGAAMHCWPDMDQAIREIHRVLIPNGGRFFATTFLSTYFGSRTSRLLQQQQVFQYFESVEQLRDLLVRNGFEEHKVHIDVLGSACVVIRCEK